MESFLRRLKFYGIGFGIGLIAVFLIFGNRACSWSPENRIKSMIHDRIIVVNELNDSILKSKQISDEKLLKMLANGDINFSKSKKNNPLKVYQFETKNLNFYSTLPENSFISEVVVHPQKSDEIQNSKIGYGRIIYFPKNQDLIYVKRNGNIDSILTNLNCKNDNDLFDLIKKSGKVNYLKSNLDDPKNLNHVLTIQLAGNKTAEISSIWYKEKIEVTDIQLFNHQ